MTGRRITRTEWLAVLAAGYEDQPAMAWVLAQPLTEDEVGDLRWGLCLSCGDSVPSVPIRERRPAQPEGPGPWWWIAGHWRRGFDLGSATGDVGGLA